jgi:hypothetical protein
MEQASMSSANSQTAEPITSAEFNISYAVSARINQVDVNGIRRQVKYDVSEFYAQPNALDARRQALEYFEQTLSDAKENQQLYGVNFNFIAPVDCRSITSGTELLLTVKCLDKPNGKSFVIADGNWNDQPSRFLKSLAREMELFQEYGCATSGEISRVTDESGSIIPILSIPNIAPLNTLFYITAKDNYPVVKKTGILAERDGYIRLLINRGASYIVASEQLHINGEYVIVEVSFDGITASIPSKSSDKDSPVIELKVRQPYIAPIHIMGQRLADTTNPNRYLINKKGNHYPLSA